MKVIFQDSCKQKISWWNFKAGWMINFQNCFEVEFADDNYS